MRGNWSWGKSWIRLLFVLGPLVAGLAWTSVYFGDGAISRDLMSDADLMYLEQVFVELFQRSGGLSQWYLTPAPYYFPDMIGYFGLRPLVPDVFWAFYVFGLFQSTALLVLAMVLTYRITGSKSAVLLTESSCLGGLALGLFGVSPFKFLYSPTYHVGTLLTGLALLTLTSGLLKSRSSASALSVFSLLIALGVASDLFIVVMFVLPLCLSLLAYLRVHGPDCRRRVVPILVCATVSSGAGILLARLLARNTAPSPFDMRLDQAIKGVTHITQKMYFVTDLGPFGCFLLAALYGLLLMRLCSFLWKPGSRYAPLDFPFWDLFVLLSASGLILFLGLRGMVHVQDPNTARYLVTIVWLPLAFIWLPLESKLRAWKVTMPVYGLVLAVALAALSATRPADRLVEPTRCPEWVEVLDSHIETLGEEGRHLRHGVSTYWQAKVATSHSKRGITVAQYKSDLSPYLWITTTRWYQPEYDFALVDDSEEDGVFLDRLVKRCGEPERVLECGGGIRLVLFGAGVLRLKAPLVHGGEHEVAISSK